MKFGNEVVREGEGMYIGHPHSLWEHGLGSANAELWEAGPSLQMCARLCEHKALLVFPSVIAPLASADTKCYFT